MSSQRVLASHVSTLAAHLASLEAYAGHLPSCPCEHVSETSRALSGGTIPTQSEAQRCTCGYSALLARCAHASWEAGCAVGELIR